MPTLTLCLTIFIVLGGMFQAGYNPSSYNTIHSHVERFVNDTNEEIQRSKTEKVSPEELKMQLDQKVANLNGLFQLFACGGAMLSIPLPVLLPYLPLKFKIIGGRKTGLWLSILLSIVGSVLSTLCVSYRSYGFLITGTLIKGISSGMLTNYGPLLMSEIVRKEDKKFFGALNLVALTCGYLLSTILGMESLLGARNTWHYILAVPGCISGFMFIAMLHIPESPKFTIQTMQSYERGRSALRQLRGSHDAKSLEQEYLQLHKENVQYTKDYNKSSISTMKNDKEQLRRMFGCIFLQISRQFSAALAMIYYSTKFLAEENLGDTFGQNGTLIMMIVLLLSSIFSTWLVRKMRLKFLYLFGLGGIVVSLSGITVLLHMMSEHKPSHFTYPNLMPYLLAVFTILLIFCFGIGPATIPWQMPFVIMDPKYQFVVSTISATVNWGGSALNAFLFPWMKITLGNNVFVPFLIIQAFMAVSLVILLPSKEDKHQDDDQKEFDGLDNQTEEEHRILLGVSNIESNNDYNNNTGNTVIPEWTKYGSIKWKQNTN